MSQLRHLKRLSVFLVLLLLSNSSLALEILTHDAHQHAEIQVGEPNAHATHGMADEGGHNQAAEAATHGGDDCICDDICCLSSIDLGLGVIDDHPPSQGENQFAPSNFYSSISLDLFLPPPTR